MGKEDLQKTRKEYYEDLFNVDPEVWVSFNVCGSDGARMFNSFEGESASRTEVKESKKA